MNNNGFQNMTKSDEFWFKYSFCKYSSFAPFESLKYRKTHMIVHHSALFFSSNRTYFGGNIIFLNFPFQSINVFNFYNFEIKKRCLFSILYWMTSIWIISVAIFNKGAENLSIVINSRQVTYLVPNVECINYVR